MVHNPGGDWNPGWGVDLRYRVELFLAVNYKFPGIPWPPFLVSWSCEPRCFIVKVVIIIQKEIACSKMVVDFQRIPYTEFGERKGHASFKTPWTFDVFEKSIVFAELLRCSHIISKQNTPSYTHLVSQPRYQTLFLPAKTNG